MQDIDAGMLQTFREESLEHLADIERDFLAMEKAGAAVDPELVHKVFRAAHSIKGGAGFIGLKTIQTLAHAMENILGLIRTKRLIPDPENINQLLLAADILKAMILKPENSGEQDISGPLQGLQSLQETTQAGLVDSRPRAGAKDPASERPPAGNQAPAAHWNENIPESPEPGRQLYGIRFYQQEDRPETDRPPELERYGTVLQMRGPDTDTGRMHTDALFASILKPEDIRLLFGQTLASLWLYDFETQQFTPCNPDPVSGKTDSAIVPDDFSQNQASQPQEDKDRSVSGAGREDETGDRVPLSPEPGPERSPSSVRVNLSLLNALLNLAGELVLSRNQLRQSIALKDFKSVESTAQDLDTVTSELQETIMKTRMQPIGLLFKKIPRLVRDVAKALGKKAVVDIRGEEVELDRTLLEHLSDPLLHLVRNALDHGLESPDERTRAGKPEAGTITVQAFQEAGQIIIDVEDDGRGLDPSAIASMAVSKGYVSREKLACMGDGEKVNLIFAPGFSTAGQISDVSGRGVGMDVVKKNLNHLGGQVQVFSRSGQGSTIRIQLPLTLAIISSLVIEAEKQKFCLPQANLLELVRIPASQVKERVERFNQAALLRLRGDLLPLVYLSDVLGLERTYVDSASGQRSLDRRNTIADRRSKAIAAEGSSPDQDPAESDALPHREMRIRPDRRYQAASSLNIAVLSSASVQYGIIVDQFHDAEEIVVKPLGRHLKEAGAYAGATILGTGDVSLILDVNTIARIAKLSAVKDALRTADAAQKEEQPAGPRHDRLKLLLFRNGAGEQFVVDMHQVIRIERITPSDIQAFGRRRYIRYQGQTLPVFSIDEAADVKPLPLCKEWLLIVSRVAGREIGLLGAGPMESVTTRSEVDDRTMKQPGILGSLLVSKQTALFVDIHDLVTSLNPEWLGSAGAQNSGPRRQTLLIAEDSRFFRTQLKAFLHNKGFTVLEAEDGRAAWDLLQRHHREIHTLITDIEMPGLNGFELARTIRADKQFAALPIIALTTLADDRDVEQGMQAGIDDYQIKLDKEQLLKSIEAMLHGRPVPPEQTDRQD